MTKWPLDETPSLKRKAPAGEPRLKRRPRKIISTEATILLKNDRPIVAEEASNEGQTETAMSITECSSKIRKPTSYNEAINDAIHGRRWREAIEEELQNLENH